MDTLLSTAGHRDQEALAAFHLDAGRRADQREADRQAIQEVGRALYLSPYLAADLAVQDTASAGSEIDRALVLDPKTEEARTLTGKIGGGPW